MPIEIRSFWGEPRVLFTYPVDSSPPTLLAWETANQAADRGPAE
jgi:hypothetical protein